MLVNWIHTGNSSEPALTIASVNLKSREIGMVERVSAVVPKAAVDGTMSLEVRTDNDIEGTVALKP